MLSMLMVILVLFMLGSIVYVKEISVMGLMVGNVIVFDVNGKFVIDISMLNDKVGY